MLAGLVVVGQDTALLERLKSWQALAGAVLGTFDCWLLRRSILSVCVAGGSAAFEIARRTQIFRRAISLGGVESLIEHRASIGVEDSQDLIDDLAQALA